MNDLRWGCVVRSSAWMYILNILWRRDERRRRYISVRTDLHVGRCLLAVVAHKHVRARILHLRRRVVVRGMDYLY